jgi:hypothetical protein
MIHLENQGLVLLLEMNLDTSRLSDINRKTKLKITSKEVMVRVVHHIWNIFMIDINEVIKIHI